MNEGMPNYYSWTYLTNVLFVDQPLGVGFSQGQLDTSNEVEIAKYFKGFYKQFAKTFNVRDSKVYLTGSGYGGHYVPYIADELIQGSDSDHFELGGISLSTPGIGASNALEQASE